MQFRGLMAGLQNLRAAGCVRAFLDGSYMTAKPRPGDFDACWDPGGVDPTLLDPVLLTFDNHRAAQKARSKGEFFPSTIPGPTRSEPSSSSSSKSIGSPVLERVSS